MDKDGIFLCSVAAAIFFWAAAESMACFIRRKTARSAMGTVVSIKLLNSETEKMKNSKWAVFSYRVDGKDRVSENRVQVPMSARIGSRFRIYYDKEKPERVYRFSLRRIAGAYFAAVMCAAIIFVRYK